VNTIETLLYAARYAAEKHAGQTRKGPSQIPYINHPLRVAELIATVGGIDDTDILAAALLHDVVEDCGVKADEIKELFGEKIAGYVSEVSDDRSLPKARRKELQIEHAPHLSAGAQTIKLADKISNITEVIADPGIGWDVQRRREYVAWGEKVVAGLRGVNKDLEENFDRLIEYAYSVIGKSDD